MISTRPMETRRGKRTGQAYCATRNFKRQAAERLYRQPILHASTIYWTPTQMREVDCADLRALLSGVASNC
jgi:hypothetical protein